MTFQHKNIFMFSGQGSQYFQMGRELYEQGGRFAAEMRAMDELVRDLSGRSVLAELYGAQTKGMPFDDIHLTHPAIFMVGYALAQCAMESGLEPDLTLGVSLGAVVAAVVSGCLTMEEGLQWVLQHAAWVSANSTPGCMIGVLGPRQLQDSAELRKLSVVAAENGPSHWVLSVPAANLDAIEDFLRARQVPFGRLPVRYPFHSPWIQGECAPAASRVPMPLTGRARTPLVCCAQAQMFSHLPEGYFWNATMAPILFEKTIRMLENSATGATCRYIDLGPSSTLATLLKYLLPREALPRVQSVLTPYGRDVQNFAALQALAQTRAVA